MQTINAKIEGTHLGFEDHGLLTCFLYLEHDKNHQGFGGYRLDALKGFQSIYGTFWVKRILETVGVQKWEDLKGQYIRIAGVSMSKIESIGHIVKDEWFHPVKEIEEIEDLK